MEKLVAKFSKGKKVDYEKKWLLIMNTELSEDGLIQNITVLTSKKTTCS
jgi:hypothetical protein